VFVMMMLQPNSSNRKMMLHKLKKWS
jgi:hypothetical protein